MDPGFLTVLEVSQSQRTAAYSSSYFLISVYKMLAYVRQVKRTVVIDCSTSLFSETGWK